MLCGGRRLSPAFVAVALSNFFMRFPSELESNHCRYSMISALACAFTTTERALPHSSSGTVRSFVNPVNALTCCDQESRRSNLRVTNGSLCHYYG